jgi:predicted membrane channel-forming protein YqfA (hemolysin III family)
MKLFKLFFTVVVWIFTVVVWVAGAIVLFVVWLDVDDATMRWIMLGVLMIWIVVVPAWQQYATRRYAHMERRDRT